MSMLVPCNSQQIQVFNGMAQFYKCFIKNLTTIMAPIMKFIRKILKKIVDRGMLKNLGAY